MKQTVIQLIKILSYVELVFGTIGSFILAYTYGQEISHVGYTRLYYTRNWGTTMGIFLAGLFSVALMFVLIYGFYMLLENQETLNSRVQELLSKINYQEALERKEEVQN